MAHLPVDMPVGMLLPRLRLLLAGLICEHCHPSMRHLHLCPAV